MSGVRVPSAIAIPILDEYAVAGLGAAYYRVPQESVSSYIISLRAPRGPSFSPFFPSLDGMCS